ncbi:MAG: J domain-containing protein [Alcanivoracaceae bacterium]|nr:J domain-containing protein [Alcanivoracaceae bacterium]
MDTSNFVEHYQVLHLPESADAILLRKHYRRLAQKLHPDAPHGDAEAFQTLQQAYNALRRYHLEHGCLPLSTIGSAPPQLAPGAGIRRKAVEKKTFRSPRRAIVSASAIIGVAVWTFLPEKFGAPESVSRHSAPTTLAYSTPTAIGEGTFSLGASLTEVIDAQGVPDWRDQLSWHYGESRVYFHEGKVVGWDEQPNSPLKIDRSHFIQTLKPTFSRGDSREQVLRAQGKPTYQTDREWLYGLSSIYFDRNRVIGWHEDPLNPLAIRRD